MYLSEKLVTYVDFASLPPEVNSGRMYAGAGAAPLRAAAAAWQGLSAQLNAAAVSYGKVLAELTDAAWRGPSAASMASAVEPYVTWMSTTAAQAAEVASQAQQAVAAYEAAFAATVPPEAVADNRTIHTALVATNVLGQNAAAIAANQAEYGEMWAQDAAAMHGYAASAAATELPALSAAPQNGQTAQSSTWDSVLDYLQNFGSNSQLVNYLNTPGNILDNWESIVTDYSSILYVLGSGVGEVGGAAGFLITPEIDELWVLIMTAMSMYPPWSNAGMAAAGLASSTSSVDAAATGLLVSSPAAQATAAEVSASMGRGTSIGQLSVSPSWATAATELRLAASTLPLPPSAGLPASMAVPNFGGLGGIGSAPVLGSVVNAPRSDQTIARRGTRDNLVPAFETLASNGPSVSRGAAGDVTTPLSDRERDELDRLRRENTELVSDRDAAARIIREAIRR